MFENLTKFTLNVLPLRATKRITFLKQGLMQAERTSDGYDSNTQTLWDMKHQFSNVPKDQAEDYSEILVKGYTAKDGLSKVKTVNYLFPSKEAAEQNKWLNTNYGFGVFYGEKTSMKQLA